MKPVLSLAFLVAIIGCGKGQQTNVSATSEALPTESSESAVSAASGLDSAFYSFDSSTGGPTVTATVKASIGTTFRTRTRSRVFDGLTWVSRGWAAQRQATNAGQTGGLSGNARIRTVCDLIGMEGLTRPTAGGEFADWSGLKVESALLSANGTWIEGPVSTEDSMNFQATVIFEQSSATNPDKMAGIACDIAITRSNSVVQHQANAVMGPTWHDIQDAFQSLVTFDVTAAGE